MRSTRIRKFFYRIGSGFYWGSSVVFILYGIMLDMNPNEGENWSELGKFIVSYVHEHQWSFFVGTIVLILCGKLLRDSAGDDWGWDILQDLVNAYREKVFKRFPDDPMHHHRVTLFKYHRIRWRLGNRPGRFTWKWLHFLWPYQKGSHPFSGWLVPTIRSGHTLQKSSSVFLCDKRNGVVEGVAGMIYLCSGTTVTAPPLKVPSDSLGKREIKQYCEESSITVDRYNKMFINGQPPPATIGGFPIENNGKLWGVLVLDSTSKQGVQATSIDDYSILISLIGKLLERT